MIKGKVLTHTLDNELTADNILKKITQYDIYRFYIPIKFSIGKAFNSFLRDDSNASASIKVSKTSQEIYYIDYAKNITMNAFQYIMALYHCNYNDALEKINRDFGLGLGNNAESQVNSNRYLTITKNYEQPPKLIDYKRIDVFPRAFTKEELDYWNLRTIDLKDLKREDIYSIDKLYLEGARLSNYSNLLRFAYYFKEVDKWKIYTPFADKKKGEHKWLSNIAFEYVEGLNNLKKDKVGIIGKSRKDAIICRKLLSEVCNSQAESEVAIPQTSLECIKENTNEAYIYWDTDETGVRACKYYNQYGFKYLNNPKDWHCKDADEIVVKYGMKKLEELFKSKSLI